MASLRLGAVGAAEPASGTSTGCEDVPCHPAPGGRTALLGLGASSLVVASAIAGVTSGWALNDWYFRTRGGPDPFVFGAGLGLGAVVTAGLSQLLVPLASPLGDDAAFHGSIGAARLGGWQRSRWAVLAASVGLGTYFAGAALERNDFGSGQALLGLGAGILTLSGLTYLVLEVTGAISGYQRSRRPRPH